VSSGRVYFSGSSSNSKGVPTVKSGFRTRLFSQSKAPFFSPVNRKAPIRIRRSSWEDLRGTR